MGAFRNSSQKSAASALGERTIDLSPRNQNPPSQPVDFEDEADMIEQVAARHGYRDDATPFKPRLRRRVVEEPQDSFSMIAKRRILDKFDLWCAQNGFTKKDGFEEMVKRVTRRSPV